MAFERARARAGRHGWWQRPGFSGAVGAIVILLAVLLVMALPLVFGTSMHGRAISCEKHVSYSSHGGNSTSYRCLVEMTGGAQRTVTADTDYGYGQTITYREFAGHTFVTRDLVQLGGILAGITALFALFVVWAGIPERKPKKSKSADEQDESPAGLSL